MGITPTIYPFSVIPENQPHASGDYSRVRGAFQGGRKSAPRQWGLLLDQNRINGLISISPTPMGITLWQPCINIKGVDQPHASGDYSTHPPYPKREKLSAPRQWGLLHVSQTISFLWSISPTPVGITPDTSCFSSI